MNSSSHPSSPFSSAPIQSPHPDLQSVLPQLATIGPHAAPRPRFDTLDEARDYLKNRPSQATAIIVPVWAINHQDLTRSRIVHWSFLSHLN